MDLKVNAKSDYLGLESLAVVVKNHQKQKASGHVQNQVKQHEQIHLYEMAHSTNKKQ